MTKIEQIRDIKERIEVLSKSFSSLRRRLNKGEDSFNFI